MTLIGNIQLKHFCDYSVLSERDTKGFIYEVNNQFTFDSYNILHKSNPTAPKEWKGVKGKGLDHTVTCGKILLGVEDKFTEATIYPSYIRRDYLPRFNGCNCLYEVVLTNDKTKFTPDSVRLLEAYNIKLMNMSDFIGFYCQLLWRQYKPNGKHVMVTSVSLNDMLIYDICCGQGVSGVDVKDVSQLYSFKDGKYCSLWSDYIDDDGHVLGLIFHLGVG